MSRERRRYVRKPVRLDGRVVTPAGTKHAGTIKDFCLGGLFVACRDIAEASRKIVGKDDRVQIQFSVPAAEGSRRYEVTARVAGLFGGGLGVEFIDPDPAVLVALQEFAKRQGKERKDAARKETATGTVAGVDRSRAFARCRKIVQDYLSENTDELFEQARSQLLEAAQQASSNVEEREYYDAAQELNNLRATIATAFGKDVLRQVDRLARGESPQEETQDEDDITDLSLVDSQSFSDWLAVKKILEKATTRNQESRYKLERRLSHLAKIPVDENTNPVGPTGLSASFHDAIQNLGVTRVARGPLFEGFDRAVVNNVGVLYDELNRMFEELGVLPGVKPSVPHRPKPQREQHTEASTEPERHEEPLAPARPQVPSSGPLAIDHAYDSARTLMDLQRRVGRPFDGRHRPAVWRAEADAAQAPDVYRTDELVDLLSRLQQELREQPAEEVERFDLRSRVIETLEQARPETGKGRVGPNEDDTVAVFGSMLNSMFDDPGVSEPMKARLGKLSIPLLKVALQDPKFFAEESHPARRLVNQLGRLDMSMDETGDIGRETMRQVVDPLVERILTRYQRDPSVFGEVLNEVDELVTRLDKAYAENVEAVIRACEAQQELIRARRKEAKEAGTEAHAKADMPEEWRQWLARAKNLDVGGALVMEQDSGETQRVHLAWKGDDPTSYVFVNSEGKKAAALSPHELAMQLRRGSAKVLDGADLPLVDRGLYAMLTGLHHRLVHEVSHDPVTGLLNRREFEERLERAVAAAVRAHKQHVLCYVDIDNFNEITDTCGQKAAERLLKQVAGVFQKHVGGRGFLARFEGDDFAMLLENCTPKEGHRIADRQRQAIEQSRCVYKGQTLPLGISIGLVDVNDQVESSEQLLEAAVAACMRARKAGGNCIEVHEVPDEEKTLRMDAMVDWENRIAKALEQSLLELRVQRIVPTNPESEEKPHFEVLLTARNDNGEATLPEDFIREAERSGQMPAVDRWVIRNTLEWMAKNRGQLAKFGGWAINLSGQTLSDEQLIEYVIGQFSESRVPPAKVIFEVTESAAIENFATAEDFIRVMKDYGCRFSLDDFGTGHASYSYLRNLAVDFVKIDGMFVKDIANNTNDYAMVKSINEIGHFMGKKTIAEYVENEEIMARLRELGVDYAQGFGIAEPVFLDEMH